MQFKPLVIGLVIAGVLGAASYGLYTFGMQRGMSMNTSAPVPPTGAGSTTQATATGADPQSVAEGEEATRRHIGDGAAWSGASTRRSAARQSQLAGLVLDLTLELFPIQLELAPQL